MKVIGLLTLVVVVAIVMMQAKTHLQSNNDENAKRYSESAEDDVNQSVGEMQKKLEDALEQSN